MSIDPQPDEVIIPGQSVSQSQMLALLTDLVATIEAFQSVTTVVYVSEATLLADLSPAADTVAIAGDTLKVYTKSGSTGTGSWVLSTNVLATLTASVGVLEGHQSPVLATAGGTADAITLATADGTITEADGLSLLFIPAAANTGAVTVALNGGDAEPLVLNAAAALTPETLGTSPVLIVWSAADSHWRLSGGDLGHPKTVMVACQDAAGAPTSSMAVTVNGSDVPVQADGVALTEVASLSSLVAAFPGGWASIDAHDETTDAIHAVAVGRPWSSAWIDADPEGSFAALYSPGVVVQSWGLADRPTVEVEKGWGSATLQDLYQDPDGYLWTGPRGTGTRADSWAGADRLFITKFYNQRAADTSTQVATPVSDALRCLLDLSTPNAPAVAGLSTGTQDGNQSATERGYVMPVALDEQALYSTFVVAAADGTETWYPIQDDAGGTTRNWRVDANSLQRHFKNWGIAVGHVPQPTMPQLILQWTQDTASFPLPTNVQRLAAAWGDVAIAVEDASLSGTSYDMTMFGPLNPLKGRAWAFGVATSDLPLAQVRFPGLPSRLAPLLARHMAADAFSIAWPQKGDVIPMDVTTRKADIPIDLVGRPGTAYEARFNGGSWGLIGRTDRNGVLRGTLAEQGMELGDLEVRERGSVSARTVSDVGVGLVIIMDGESGADGRGDNVTVTDTDYIRLNKAAIGTSNRWMLLIGEVAYDYWGGSAKCPTGFFANSQGSTWMVPRPGQPATDGHWNADNDGTSQQRRVKTQVAQLIAANADRFPSRVRLIEDLGLNDAAVGAANTDMAADWQTHAIAKRAAWRAAVHADLNVHHIVSLAADTMTDASLDRVRAGQVALWDIADAFGSAGSQADLDAPTDPTGVHLWSQAEKLVAAERAFRCAILGERAPRYSSAAIDGSDIDITLTGGTSPMVISAPTDVAGWTVSDDNGARTVTAVAVSGLVVTLTCDQALVGDVSIQWCSGDTGVGTTLKDSHTIAMPPEPFGPVIIT